MQVIGHGEGDLGGARLGWLIAGHPGQPVAEPGEQGGVVRSGLPAHAPGLALRAARAHAEEAQVQVFRREGGVHGADRLGVGGAGMPDQHRGPVGQQCVGPGTSAGHPAAPEPSGPALSPAGTMREYWSGSTIAMWPSFSHLMMYGGEPSADGTPTTSPIRSPPTTRRSPTRARIQITAPRVRYPGRVLAAAAPEPVISCLHAFS